MAVIREIHVVVTFNEDSNVEALLDVVTTVVDDLAIRDVLGILVYLSLVIILIKVMHPWR